MDLDGIIKYSDAQGRAAAAQASMADTLADIPQKLAQAELTNQQAIQQHLKNVELFMNISFDAEAHQHLERMRIQALQEVRAAKLRWQQFEAHARRLTWIMSGRADWTATQQGWIGWDYVFSHVPAAITVKALSIKPDGAVFDPAAWKHPTHKLPDMPESRDAGSILDWARKGTCYPVLGGAAWAWMGQAISTVDEGLKAEAASLQAATDKAVASANALQQIEWDRLKKPDKDAK